MTDAAGTSISIADGLILSDKHDGTATLQGTPGGTSGQTGNITIKFTASNSNVNVAARTGSHIPYTTTQTVTLAVRPQAEWCIVSVHLYALFQSAVDALLKNSVPAGGLAASSFGCLESVKR